MKIFKRLLIIFVLTIIGLSIGYFVYGYARLNNFVEKDVYKNQFFKTRDEENFISFGNFSNTVLCINMRYYFIDEVEYTENIFTFNVEQEVFYFIAIDDNTVYSDYFNLYFYSLERFKL